MAFPDDWNYYKEYEQPGTADGKQTDYQVNITVTHVTDKMLGDFGDVRFTLTDNTELDYHLLSYTASTSAVFVVKIPTLPTGGVTLRVWYGNPDATTTSDPENTHDFFDDFPGTSLNTDKWELVNSSTITVSDSCLNISIDSYNGSYQFRGIKTKNFINTNNRKVYTKFKKVYARANVNTHITGYYNLVNSLLSIVTSNLNLAMRLDNRGTGGSIYDDGFTSMAVNTWYNCTLLLISSKEEAYVVEKTETKTRTSPVWSADKPLAIGFENWKSFTGPADMIVDWIYVDKYTANPPTTGSFGSEINPLHIGNAVASGLPLDMYFVPTGEAVATGLPVYFANWEFISVGNATASGLEIEKWFAYTPSFFIENEDGIILTELSFESLHPGKKSVVKKLTAVNNLESEMVMTLTPAESLNQIGDGLDTYLSQYHSIDDINYSNSALTLTIPALGELDFYTYWQPPSTGKIGWKQWLYDLDLEGVPSLEGWGYVSWFQVTGTGVAINIPYTLDELIRVDYVHGLMENDFKDIRFALPDHTILKYDLHSKVDGDHAYFAVQLPNIPASPNSTIVYVYSGNPNAEDESDPTIVQFNEHFPGTSLDLEKWEPNAVGNISYSVNNQLIVTDCSRYVYSQHQSKWDVPSAFNIQYNIISDGLYLGSRFGVGLVKSDDSQIIFVGFYSPTNNAGQPEDVILVSEGVWTNVADGWTGSGTNTVSKAFGTSAHDTVFNIEKNGSIISAYVDGTHIADTTIVSTIYRAAIIAYKNGINFNVAQQQVNYIGEADVVTQTPPTVGSMNQSWINTYPLPVKADILYQSCDLPDLISERRFAVKLGDNLYE